ncbi:unnamed protein product, partial [Anisakis simplex]|uniref:Uncharacterized protein n=1 Tax=Anisakis simplex TaxID=6269 RepID=A0A0M3JQN8_ANISI
MNQIVVDEEEDMGDVVSARPRRVSELTQMKQQKPIPKASSLFIL